MTPDPIILKLAVCLITLAILAHFHIQQRRAHRQKGQHDPSKT